MRRIFLYIPLIILVLTFASCNRAEQPVDVVLDFPEEGTAHLIYFYADECAACGRVSEKILTPIIKLGGAYIDARFVDISTPQGYAVFFDTETFFTGDAGQWEIPTVIAGNAYLTGEDAIRQQLQPELQSVLNMGGDNWPGIDSLLAYGNTADNPEGNSLNFQVGEADSVESCAEDDAEICESPSPIFVLYLHDAKYDDTCDRTLYDLRYLQGIFPDMQFEERVMSDNEALVKVLLEQYGYENKDAGVTPAIFVGEDYLAGQDVTFTALKDLLYVYAEAGAAANWYLVSVD